MALSRQDELDIILRTLDILGNSADEFLKVRDTLIRQGELEFEAETKDHPFSIELPDLNSNEEQLVKVWLEERFEKSDYIFMPINAQGKYKDCWNWVYFKKKDQAMLFKLTWA